MVADQDQLLVESADIRVAPLAVQRDPPLQHCSRDVDAPWDHSVKFTRVLRANVEDMRTGL